MFGIFGMLAVLMAVAFVCVPMAIYAPEIGSVDSVVQVRGQGNISEAQAEDIVLAANPSATVVKATLEQEKNSSVYEVKIRSADGKTDVLQVDNSGRIVSADIENNEDGQGRDTPMTIHSSDQKG